MIKLNACYSYSKARKMQNRQRLIGRLGLSTRDNNNDIDHVATWGRTIKDCELAAISGNNQKRHMGWPESECHATPSRLTKKGITL